MKVLSSLDLTAAEQETVLTIGSFDGVHRGHQHLVSQVVARAHETGRLSAAMTFHPHPRVVLRPGTPAIYLTSLEDRLRLLEELGLDIAVLLNFTTQFAATPAEVFVRSLYSDLCMRELWVGPDFGLGRNKEGNIDRLRAMGIEMGYELHVVVPHMEGGEPISSTRIRQLLFAGQVREAARLLGRPYSFTAQVKEGEKRGRQLGFRTANLRPEPERVLPANGVYAAWVRHDGTCHMGVANLGVRPSFGEGERLLEAHILDYEGDLYGETLSIAFVEHLRPEERFADVSTLVAQIGRDVQRARAVLAADREQQTEHGPRAMCAF